MFGLPTPEEVREAQKRKLFTRQSQTAHGYAGEMIGKALGYGLRGLFGMESAQEQRAAKIQGIQQKVSNELGLPTTQQGLFDYSQRLSGELLKAGELELGYNLMERAAKLRPEGKEPDFKQLNVHRKAVSDVTKNIRAIDESTKKMESAAKRGNAQSDMAMIFTYMKILDPQSTVREGEFATAEQTTGVPGYVVNLYNRALQGTRLNPEQRRNFLTEAKGLRQASREAADVQIENILQQADIDQIAREKVLGKGRLQAFQQRRTRKPTTSLDERAKALGL